MAVTWLTSCNQHEESPGYAGWFGSRTPAHTPVLYCGTILSKFYFFAHSNYLPVLKTAAVKIVGCTLSPHDPHKYSSACPKTRPPHPSIPAQKTLLPYFFCAAQTPLWTWPPSQQASSSILPPRTNAYSSFTWFSCSWSAPLSLCNPLRPRPGFWGPQSTCDGRLRIVSNRKDPLTGLDSNR